jgi:hypothetical protein
MVEEIMAEEEAWKAEQEVARIAAGQPPAQPLRSGTCRRCPMGGATTATTVAGANKPLAAQLGKPLSLAQGSAAYS